MTISDVNVPGLEETKNMIKIETGKDENILAVKLDVSNRNEVSEIMQQAKTKYGPIDILINNAGIV